MALPQQVIDRLSQNPEKTPGWSFGIVFFSGAIFFIMLILYFGFILGYEPYLNGQISQVQTQIGTLSQAVSSNDQANLIQFYSEISNLQSLIQNHILFSNFLAWLEANTETNVYFNQLSFAGGNQVSLSGAGQTEADVNEQIAIFAASPEIQSMSVSGVSLDTASGLWEFKATLIMSPSLFTAQASQPQP